MKCIAILRFSHFPSAGHDGVISSLHADLHEGEIVRRGEELLYSYNAFASPLITFHPEAIVVHDSLRARLGQLISFKKCKPGRILYFPYWKVLDIDVDRNLAEQIEMDGVFRSFPEAPCDLRKKTPYCAILPNRPTSVIEREIVFDSRCAMSKIMVELPAEECSRPWFYSDRIIWIFSESFFAQIDRFVDRDFYCVRKVEY